MGENQKKTEKNCKVIYWKCLTQLFMGPKQNSLLFPVSWISSRNAVSCQVGPAEASVKSGKALKDCGWRQRLLLMDGRKPPIETPFGDFDLQLMLMRLSDRTSKRTLLALGAAPAGRADALGHAVDSKAFTTVPAASVTRHCQRKRTQQLKKWPKKFILILSAQNTQPDCWFHWPLWQYLPPNPGGHLHFPGRRQTPPFLHLGSQLAAFTLGQHDFHIILLVTQLLLLFYLSLN